MLNPSFSNTVRYFEYSVCILNPTSSRMRMMESAFSTRHSISSRCFNFDVARIGPLYVTVWLDGVLRTRRSLPAFCKLRESSSNRSFFSRWRSSASRNPSFRSLYVTVFVSFTANFISISTIQLVLECGKDLIGEKNEKDFLERRCQTAFDGGNPFDNH